MMLASVVHCPGVAELAARLGLEDPFMFVTRRRAENVADADRQRALVGDRYDFMDHGQRDTGRSTLAVLRALTHARQGENVVLVAASSNSMRFLRGLLDRYASELDMVADVAKHVHLTCHEPMVVHEHG